MLTFYSIVVHINNNNNNIALCRLCRDDRRGFVLTRTIMPFNERMCARVLYVYSVCASNGHPAGRGKTRLYRVTSVGKNAGRRERSRIPLAVRLLSSGTTSIDVSCASGRLQEFNAVRSD